MEVRRAAVDLEHLVRDAVEHVTVVGHEQQAAAERGQPFLEVRDGVEVEVVGRLVEDQRIPLAGEQRGERDALLLPARQLVGRRVEQRRHAQPTSIASPCHASPTASRTVPAGSTGSCGEHADPHAAATAHDAGLGFAVAAHDPQQRALAAAVETDDADAVAVAEREREIGEQRPVRAACAATPWASIRITASGYEDGESTTWSNIVRTKST